MNTWEEAAARVRDLIAELPILEAQREVLREAVIQLAKAVVRQTATDSIEIVEKTWYEVFGRK